MPVDTTMDFTPKCEPEIENHYYDVYGDGSHANRCRCGKVVVLATPDTIRGTDG